MAENSSEWRPITLKQLMEDRGMQGGNFTFKFDEPIFAVVKFEASSKADPKNLETVEKFVSEKPDDVVKLFFLVKKSEVDGKTAEGRFTYGSKEILVELSNCQKSSGRVLRYPDVFKNIKGVKSFTSLSPHLPKIPELNKEYILHYYAGDRDPYVAKFTVAFVTNLDHEPLSFQGLDYQLSGEKVEMQSH